MWSLYLVYSFQRWSCFQRSRWESKDTFVLKNISKITEKFLILKIDMIFFRYFIEFWVIYWIYWISLFYYIVKFIKKNLLI